VALRHGLSETMKASFAARNGGNFNSRNALSGVEDGKNAED
jgi:hypothetical protein